MTQPKSRTALVLGGGGARGAYEAGVLAYLFEEIYPRLPPGFEFDIVSGSSVGAIHAAYVGASAHQPLAERAGRLLDTWREMQLADVLRLSPLDLLGLPLRALGLTRLRRGEPSDGPETRVVGGLVDFSALEWLVLQRISWSDLAANLDAGRPGALCVSCTEVRSGKVTVFIDGALGDARPWAFDPNANALQARIDASHVRASAAIPFLFPAVLVGDRYYVDGGLRMNTPLSPALRLACDRALVISLKHQLAPEERPPAYATEVITQPAFLLGKVLDALTLERVEYELARIDLVNNLIQHGQATYGEGFLETLNAVVAAGRGVGYREVRTFALRPSEDLGRVAWRCHEQDCGRSLGFVASQLARTALRGVPAGEGDLLSYLYFDRSFTRELLELGRSDARAAHDQILELLGA